jgi:NAD(P)-dependent dehydrogenase (short-subunit alcohol dehydrogenase family)
VNISSAATLGLAHEYVHYAAAKAGVDALTVGLSKELAADGLRVNAVARPTAAAVSQRRSSGETPVGRERVGHEPQMNRRALRRRLG